MDWNLKYAFPKPPSNLFDYNASKIDILNKGLGGKKILKSNDTNDFKFIKGGNDFGKHNLLGIKDIDPSPKGLFSNSFNTGGAISFLEAVKSLS